MDGRCSKYQKAYHVGAGLRGQIVKFNCGDEVVDSLLHFMHNEIQVDKVEIEAKAEAFDPLSHNVDVEGLEGSAPDDHSQLVLLATRRIHINYELMLICFI